MTTLNQMVLRMRGMLTGGQAEDMSSLAEDYVAGSGQIVLRYGKKNLAVGSIVSVGLTTFQVFEASADTKTFKGFGGADGGPDVDYPAGTLVRVKPSHSTWAVFDELSGAIESLSAPRNGLYRIAEYTPTELNRFDGTYPLPEMDQTPVRLLSVRWRTQGTDAWSSTGNAEFVQQDWVVRVYGSLPMGDSIEFLFAMPFARPASLDDDLLTVCGIDAGLEDCVLLGAASNLALSSEGRRVSVFSQGDARRAEEVKEGANIGVSRMYAAQFQSRVDEEYGRLLRLWPIIHSSSPIFDQATRWPGYSR